MAKRQLTRRQQWRIDKIQQARVNRATSREAKLQEELIGGDFGAEQQGLVIAHFGSQVAVEDEQGQIWQCHLRANLPAIVTGDKVIWRAGNQQNGIISALLSRDSELCRTDSYGNLKAIAANLDLLVIVFAPLPTPYGNILDRYLIAAEQAKIKPLLLFNKIDLLQDKTLPDYADLLAIYARLGYQVCQVSSHYPATIQRLRQLLSLHTSVFVGQSGVGKSSLINALLPSAELRVGALSEFTFKGTHTTTTARLFHLAECGQLIDSPGIRDFALSHLDKATIEQGFIEFKPFLGHCKFRNCQHLHEPNCALLTAVAEGKISQQRMDSYRYILNSLALENGYKQEG